MPVDRQGKLIFIHTPKCAGTTIARALGIQGSRGSHAEDREHLYGFDKDGTVMQSLCLKFYDDYLPDEFIRSCFIFGVARNPYDRVLSDYSWDARGCKSLHTFLLLIKDTLHTRTDKELMRFEKSHQNHFLPQHRYFESEKYQVDAVLKFENLEEDFSRYVNKTIRLGHWQRSKHRPWREVFSDKPECTKLVNELYGRDFELFGYETLTE